MPSECTPRFKVSLRGNLATSGAGERPANPLGQTAPAFAVMHAEMPFVAAEQFVRALADQRDLHVLPRALADEIHRHDGRGGDRFFQKANNIRQRFFKLLLVQYHLMMPRAQQRRGFGGVHQFVIRKLFP